MPDALDRLRGTDQAPGAAPHRLAFLAHGMAAARRANIRENVFPRVLGTIFRQDVEDLRDYIPCSLHHDRIAFPDVTALADRLAAIADAPNIVLIVQRRVGHHDPAHRYGLQTSHRRQRPGTPDLDIDLVQDRCRLLGGEFVRGRPTRAAGAEAQPVLQVQPVDLVDDAVDIIGQRRALGLDRPVLRQHIAH